MSQALKRQAWASHRPGPGSGLGSGPDSGPDSGSGPGLGPGGPSKKPS